MEDRERSLMNTGEEQIVKELLVLGDIYARIKEDPYSTVGDSEPDVLSQCSLSARAALRGY